LIWLAVDYLLLTRTAAKIDKVKDLTLIFFTASSAHENFVSVRNIFN